MAFTSLLALVVIDTTTIADSLIFDFSLEQE
jgi:hypothetical protein